MYILGISAFYHDSAAAILCDGQIVAAAQEERFTRRKFDAAFPSRAIQYCLEQAGIRLSDLDHVVFHDKPIAKFDRLIRTFAWHAPRGFWAFRMAIPQWLGGKLFQRRLISRALRKMGAPKEIGTRLLFAEHHQSHASSAFYPSPFDEALVVTLDGVGEWATTTVSLGTSNAVKPQLELSFPHSLGLLYSAITQYLGFKVLSGEYKVMGLAPYGVPRFRDVIVSDIIELKPDGSFRLDQSYFDYSVGQRMFSEKLEALFGRKARQGDDAPLEQFHMDVAASLQAVTEEAVLRICGEMTKRYGQRNLCLAGGVALNCVANGRLLRELGLDGLWIQPAAGDAGCAVGAALAVWHDHLGRARVPSSNDSMSGAYLGPSFSEAEIREALEAAGAVFEHHAQDALLDAVCEGLQDGNSVGWMQGRMEFGPRALGNRSILADPRRPDVQSRLNLQIKYRESFRPFAPAILEEDASDWFDLEGPSPYMLITADVLDTHRLEPSDKPTDIHMHVNQVRSSVPAVTHVDHSARVQTVSAATNPKFHALLGRFKDKTGCPILVNTSFNIRGEPIVCTPEDAFRCFMGTEMDMLVIGGFLLKKQEQTVKVDAAFKSSFAPD